METIRMINKAVGILFILCYSYQVLYMIVSLLNGTDKSAEGSKIGKKNRYAVLICARNEEKVIGDLLDSIKAQTYPKRLISSYVMADNCTDLTAEVAKAHSAEVYERHDSEKIGKGFALDMLLNRIKEDKPEGYDGYFVFDADNILAADYIEMMDRTFSQGYDIVTGYRNSKNYSSNWISAGNALCFMRENRFLNLPRYLLGTSCSVTGTGFLFSRTVEEEMDGWPYHLLTEDLEFTADQISRGRKIAFCKEAEFYDEQPVSFRQSWDQRIRWAKGYIQVFFRYISGLTEGMVKRLDFSCLDCIMNIPVFILSAVSFGCSAAATVLKLRQGATFISAFSASLRSLAVSYLVMFMLGVLTTLSEWNKIHASAKEKIAYMFTFPLFMFTYIPVTAASLFTKVTWKPIEHTFSARKLAELGLSKNVR